MNYRGWEISETPRWWQAHQWGVRMRGNSLRQIRRMIDLKLDEGPWYVLKWEKENETGRE